MPKHSDVSRIIKKAKALTTEKAVWVPLYDLISEFVTDTRRHFTNTVPPNKNGPGATISQNQFDQTAGKAADLLAAAMVGALWPNGARSVRLRPPQELALKQLENEEVKEYYEKATRIFVTHMDAAESGFHTALDEYFLDQAAFGTSGIGVFEDEDDDETPVYYQAIDATTSDIAENPRGNIDTIYRYLWYTPEQLVELYGESAVSKKTLEAYRQDKLDPIRVLHAVEPRRGHRADAKTNKEFAYASYHIEMDSEHLLRESGYREQPIYMGRFRKAINEKYGRSPAMRALSDIMELNMTRETSIIVKEQLTDPALVVLSEGGHGPDIDKSPGAVTVLNISGRLGTLNQRPIDRLFPVGDPSWADQRIQELQESISQHFSIDRLLDLNNESRMTLGEANIRNQLRQESLGTIYARQTIEIFTPVVKRTFNILFERGYLGVIRGTDEDLALQAAGRTPFYIPDAVAKLAVDGEDMYDIEFISPAARIMQASELNGITQTLEVAGGLGGLNPDSLDNVDFDELMRRVIMYTGAPEEILNSVQAVKAIREARQAAQQAQVQSEQQRLDSETARNIGQTASMLGGVGEQAVN